MKVINRSWKLKTKFASLLVLLGLALALAGCGDSGATSTSAAPTTKAQPTAAAVTTPASLTVRTAKPTPFQAVTASTNEEVLPVFPGAKPLEVPTLVQHGLGGWSGSLLMDHPTYQTYTVSGEAKQIVNFYTEKLAELDYIDSYELDSKVNGVTTHREDYGKKEKVVSVVIIGPLDEHTYTEMTGEYPELVGKINVGTTIMVIAKDRNPVAE